MARCRRAGSQPKRQQAWSRRFSPFELSGGRHSEVPLLDTQLWSPLESAARPRRSHLPQLQPRLAAQQEEFLPPTYSERHQIYLHTHTHSCGEGGGHPPALRLRGRGRPSRLGFLGDDGRLVNNSAVRDREKLCDRV